MSCVNGRTNQRTATGHFAVASADGDLFFRSCGSHDFDGLMIQNMRDDDRVTCRKQLASRSGFEFHRSALHLDGHFPQAGILAWDAKVNTPRTTDRPADPHHPVSFELVIEAHDFR